MPIYEFICNDCKEEYEDITEYDETEKYEDVVCPKCESQNKLKLISACSHAFTNPIGTDKWSKHDYRFKHNLPKVLNERKNAEINSHMGQTPYGQSDMLHQDIEKDTGIHDAEEGPTMLTDYE